MGVQPKVEPIFTDSKVHYFGLIETSMGDE